MKKNIFIFIALLFVGCSQKMPGANVPIDRQREYASALFNQQLYKQSIDEYKKVLEFYDVDNKLSANINYTIANIYFENLGDFPNAMTHYLRIKHLYRESDLYDDANKKIIASLERMGKTMAAASLLKESVDIKGEEVAFKHLPGDTVAIIENEPLTSGDLDRLFNFFVSSLPEDQQVRTRDAKLAFLRDYVKREVLYNSAKRQSLDQDTEVMELAFMQKKTIMIDKLLQKEIYEKIVVNDTEIEKFYNDNKSKFLQKMEDGTTKNMTFEEAKDTARQFAFLQKAQSRRNQLTDKLITAQKAKIFMDKVK